MPRQQVDGREVVSPDNDYRREIARPYAFISYSRRNVRSARSLVGAFAYRRIPCWFDAKIRPSEVWHDELLAAVEGAACVVVIVTRQAADSEWVRTEVAYALEHDKPVIPIHRERDHPRPAELQHIQHVTITNVKRLPGPLLTALYEYCGPSTVRVYTNEERGITDTAAGSLTGQLRGLGVSTMVRSHGLRELAPDALFIHAGTSPEVLITVLDWLPYEAQFLYPPEYEDHTFPDLDLTVDSPWHRPAAVTCGLCSALNDMRRDLPAPWETVASVTPNSSRRSQPPRGWRSSTSSCGPSLTERKSAVVVVRDTRGRNTRLTRTATSRRTMRSR